MKIFVAILSVFVLISSSFASGDQPSVKYAVGALSREGLDLRHHAKEIPTCILRALRRWMQRPFVIVDQDQPFPPVTDIRHTGDGQFRLFFFSELSPETTLLCFEDDGSLGRSYRAFFFSKRGSKCVVEHQFAFRHPVRSIKELRAALNERARSKG